MDLRRAGYHFNRGLGLDRDVRSWFAKPLDPPQVPPDFIRSLVPPDGDADEPRQSTWRLAGADWANRLRHGFQAPDCVVVGADAEDLLLIDFSDDSSYRFELPLRGDRCQMLAAVGGRPGGHGDRGAPGDGLRRTPRACSGRCFGTHRRAVRTRTPAAKLRYSPGATEQVAGPLITGFKGPRETPRTEFSRSPRSDKHTSWQIEPYP